MIRKVNLTENTPTITTIAGKQRSYYSSDYSGDGGSATDAQLSFPTGITVRSSSGHIFFSDYYNYRIRFVDSEDTIFTYLGNGTNSFDLMNAISTTTDICFDLSENLIIADTGNRVIRKVTDTSGEVVSDVVVFE